MNIKPRHIDIDMVPGDSISINVGINYKCDIEVSSNGKLKIYYENVNCLEI